MVIARSLLSRSLGLMLADVQVEVSDWIVLRVGFVLGWVDSSDAIF